MPVFDFTVSEKKASKPKLVSNVLKKDVTGVVWITLKGEYRVKVDNDTYPIHKDNFDSKGHEIIYSTKLGDDKRRLVHIRGNYRRNSVNSNCYLPFAPGSVVKGDIVLGDVRGGKIFNIKKIQRVVGDFDSITAFRYWKDNYLEIQANIKERNG